MQLYHILAILLVQDCFYLFQEGPVGEVGHPSKAIVMETLDFKYPVKGVEVCRSDSGS